MKIIWAEPTNNDLKNIKEFIKKGSDYYAEIFTLKLINAADILENFPEAGRIVPEYNKSYIREIIFKGYRIIYKIESEYIYVLTVIHGSRDLKRHINENDII